MSRQVVGVENEATGVAAGRHLEGSVPPPLHSKLRTAFALIAVAGVATGLIFGIFPQLDLQISALFYDPLQRTWPANQSALYGAYRDLSAYLAAVLAIIAVGALALAPFRRRAPSLLCWRVAAFLIGSLLLGPGLIANVLLKPLWGRPRPAAVTEFGGSLDFTAWWNPHGQCDGNCSFVSGETSLAVWLIAWAVVLPARYRAAGMTVALLQCAFMGASRIATGAHFASDVLFAVIVTALSIWAMYWVALRDAGIAATSPHPAADAAIAPSLRLE
jgi:membrane-associated PAP2 superfamily phosphatase